MSYSVVKIELKKPPGTEYKVYWDMKKHNHGADTAAGTAAVKWLAGHINVPVADLNYRSGSFQSNQSSAPSGKNVYEMNA